MIEFSLFASEIATLCRRVVATDGSGAPLPVDDGVFRAVSFLDRARREGSKAMVLGNGGSAAIAGHLHNDLAKAAGMRALAFQDVSLLTAMSNDHGYDSAYDSGVRQWAEAGDVLIAISSSGESENMLLAAATARKAGCRIITLSGFAEENRLRQAGDLNFYVPSAEYGLVETVHAVLAHYLTDRLEGNGRERMNHVPAR